MEFGWINIFGTIIVTIMLIPNIIYKFMPKKVFEQIGCNKKDLITLMDSMKNLTIPQKAPNIMNFIKKNLVKNKEK